MNISAASLDLAPLSCVPQGEVDTVIHRNDPGMQVLVCTTMSSLTESTSHWHSQAGNISALPLPVMSPQTQRGLDKPDVLIGVISTPPECAGRHRGIAQTPEPARS